MSNTKRLRTKDEELAYKRVMAQAADYVVAESTPIAVPVLGVMTLSRYVEIAKMVSDDIKRMAKVPL